MYSKIIHKIRNNEFSRSELALVRENASRMAQSGDENARAVLDEIATCGVTGSDRRLAFIGFCPAGDIDNRLDGRWISEGICEFDYVESQHQQQRFSEIMTGDTLILKKREQFGETMRLYSSGTVREVVERGRLLKVNWRTDCGEIVMPLMGCNSTVDIKSIEVVEKTVPDEFWRWLGWTTG